MNFKIIEPSQKEWNDYIEKSKIYDFHHTSCFHNIETTEASEKALMFIAKDRNEFIALPLIKRSIPNSSLFDLTSVYGYAGPITSQGNIEPGLIDFFTSQFLQFCHQENIIAAFSRLNPMIQQDYLFEDLGQVIDKSQTVAIDLSLELNIQRRAYRKSNKSEINQLRKKKGYTVQKIQADDAEGIKSFLSIYHATMEKVDASDGYFFDFGYIQNLLSNPCFKCDLLAAFQEGNMAAGAIFTSTKKIMEYHLSGTDEKYLHDTPIKLIIDEARILGTENKLDFLHLGGGVGGSHEDSLFRFKSGFSKNFLDFKLWKFVVDEKHYNQLAKENGKNPQKTDFFPAYRA